LSTNRFPVLKVVVLCCATLLAAGTALSWLRADHVAGNQPSRSAQASDPWTPEQTVKPAALAKEIDGPAAHRPKVVCVGFHTLYEGAHVPGASFHGPARERGGLDDLKKWARTLPRSADIVFYCGCCPLTHCPNVRPAFEALRQMGFTRVRLLLLPADFAHDWVAAGYPVSKGK
jgi:thiosulfate/3-mercaptopyruvate sulfurtransferase